MIEDKKAIEQFQKRFAQLKKVRTSYESWWQDVIDYVAPDLDGYINKDCTSNEGDRTDSKIYNSDPPDSLMAGTAGLFSSTTSPSTQWYGLTMQRKQLNVIEQARQFLDDIKELQYQILSASNYYDSTYVADLHLMAIGTSCTIYFPDYENVWRAETLNVGSYWLGRNYKGEVDTIYREPQFTGQQLVDEFGDSVPQRIRDRVKDNHDTETMYKVTHVIEPNRDKLGPFPKRFVSAYFLSSGHDNTFLKISGFEQFPSVGPVWFRNQGETYGKNNPGRSALPDIKQLNIMTLDFNESCAKINRPPMQGKADLLEGVPLDIRPGAYNQLGNNATTDQYLKPLFAVNPDLKSQWDSILAMSEKIAKKFYVDKFQPVLQRQDKQMTAAEVYTLSNESLVELGPVSRSLDKEKLTPEIDILTNYMIEAGIFPPAPEELQGQTFLPKYESVLAIAQKTSEIQKVDSFMQGVIGVYGATQDPSVMDCVDIGKWIEWKADVTNIPAGILRDDATKQALAQQRQQAQQAQQMAVAMQQGAEIAKTAGDAKTGDNGLLGQIMAGAQNG